MNTAVATTEQNTQQASTEQSAAATEQNAQASTEQQQSTEQNTQQNSLLDGNANSNANPEKQGGDADQPTGAPESYEAFTMPEGYELDAESNEAFVALAKESDLTQENAQKYVDLATNLVERTVQETMKTVTEQISNAHAEKVQGWKQEAIKDTEIGGEQLPKTLATGNKLLETYGDEDLKAVLKETGLDNNLAFIRFLNKTGVSLLPDDIINGDAKPPEGDRLSRMYPSMTK